MVGHMGKGLQQAEGSGAKRPRRPLLRVAYWTTVVLVWCTMAGFVAFLWIAHGLPDLDDLPPPGREATITVEAANGAVLARYGPIYGDWLDYRDIPEPMILALLAIEDRRFFDHGGIDPYGILRAAFANLRRGSLREGGSTITQQLAKNLFLSHARTLRRKAEEFLMALWLERRFSKEEILTLYLNRVYFGSGTYGIDAASRTFFGHDARRLDLAEAAMLAGIVQAPSRLAPTHDYEAALARSHQVLAAMVDAGYLTPEAAARTRERPPKTAAATGPDIRYFTDWARSEAERLIGADPRSLVIGTTLDPAIQAAAEHALKSHIEKEGKARNVSEGALIALAHDGAVLAMMGGVSWSRSQYNRATQARRQPGSAFKPILYLAGLEAGLAPDDIEIDEPVTIEGWSPANFSGRYEGAMTLGEAFSRSVNSIAVKVWQHAGASAVLETARRLGIESPLADVPSLALGTSGIRLIELAAAYAAIANGGTLTRPYAILEIRTRSGEVLYRPTPAGGPRVIAAKDRDALVAMMERTITTGTGRAARIDRPAAGKTGTSQDYRDALFVGFSSDIVAAVWVGNDDETPMRGVTGGGLPAHIWADFMIDAHIGHPVRPLPQSPGSGGA